MARILAAPALLAVSVFGGIWLASTFTLGLESSQLLERCQAISTDPASCHLRTYGR